MANGDVAGHGRRWLRRRDGAPLPGDAVTGTERRAELKEACTEPAEGLMLVLRTADEDHPVQVGGDGCAAPAPDVREQSVCEPKSRRPTRSRTTPSFSAKSRSAGRARNCRKGLARCP